MRVVVSSSSRGSAAAEKTHRSQGVQQCAPHDAWRGSPGTRLAAGRAAAAHGDAVTRARDRLRSWPE
eukprot:5722250-Heterocapsa_arctica.AAC.1